MTGTNRRGRKAAGILGLALLALLLVALLGTVSVSGADRPTTEKMVTCVRVEYGDTLWSIAEEHYTEEWGSVAEYVEEIQACNQLWDDAIQAGESLVVPYYTAK